MSARVPGFLLAPLLSLDAVLLGGSLRRAVRNYVGDDPEQRDHGVIPVDAARSIARGLWHERTIPASRFVKQDEIPRLLGGTTGRSGTTWLMDLLGRELGGHYLSIREMGLFDLAQFRGAPYEYFQYANLPSRPVYRRYFRYFILERAYFIRRKLDGTMLGLCDLLPRRAVRIALDHLEQRLEEARSLEDIEQSFGAFYLWLFNCHAELVAPGRPWISKEPPYGRHADLLLRMIPETRLVVLVRDGRDVASSMHAHDWHATLRDAMDRWRHFTQMTADALARCPQERVRVVRYRDLVHDFEREMAGICSFLQLPPLKLPAQGVFFATERGEPRTLEEGHLEGRRDLLRRDVWRIDGPFRSSPLRSPMPSKPPLVSIVVPVFNGAEHLAESLETILAQTHPSIEILVMDDASTDDTPAVIASYGDRIRCIRQPQNKGIYGNTNDGIAVSKGKYIAFYHADDISYDPEIVASEVTYLEEHPEVAAVFCKDILIDGQGHETGRVELPEPLKGEQPLDFKAVFNALLTYKNPFLRCPSCMARRALYEELGGFNQAEFFNTADLEMWIRMARNHSLGILDRHLFRYRHGHGNSSGRYHHLRTDPNRFFPIMDLYLERGGRPVATPEALEAYEGHRAEDRLMRAVSLYIQGDRHRARVILARVKPGEILRGHELQRARMMGLLVIMKVLVRIPRIGPVADAFYRRWHAAKNTG